MGNIYAHTVGLMAYSFCANGAIYSLIDGQCFFGWMMLIPCLIGIVFSLLTLRNGIRRLVETEKELD